MKNNPYIGPRPFERSDRERFFGRARETRDLLSLIMAERVVLFYAQSGAGKTSLLNTQIIPALEEEGFKVLPIARVGSDVPRGVEAAAVTNIFVFSALLTLAEPPGEIGLLAAQTLPGFLTTLTNDEHPPILILDQFEEILTTHRDRWEDARGFFEQLRDALQAIPKLGVVLAMREDHVAGLDPYAALLPKRLRTRFRMELLGYDGALEAVRKPAQNAGCAYGTGVAERLVDDLRRIQITSDRNNAATGVLGPYVEPVQLQVVCSRLWDNLPEREERVITWPEIEQFGNIDRALTDFYESALQHTTQETGVTERQLRRWFGTELITPMKTRGLALRGERDTNGLPNEAVDVLDRQHLIRAESRAGAYWYELAHDRLVEPIVNSNAAWEQARMTPLRATARNWQQSKNADLLYGGKALLEAQHWAHTHPADVEDYEQEFLNASNQAQRVKARTRIMRLTVIAALSVGMILMAALAMLAWQSKQDADQQRTIAYEAKATAEAGQQEAERQRQIAVTAQSQADTSWREAEQQARQARSGQLAAQSQAALSTRPQRSLLLAIEALTVTQQAKEPIAPAVRQALFDALSPMSGRGLTVQYKPISNMALSADGRWLATIDEDQVTRLWDMHATESTPQSIELPGKADRIAISPDSRWLAASGNDPAIRLWDLKSPQLVTVPIALNEQDTPANEIVFSPDSRWLVTSDNLVARLWDLTKPDRPRVLEIKLYNPELPVSVVDGERDLVGLSFSPDSRWLVAGGGRADTFLHLWDLTSANLTTTSAITVPDDLGVVQTIFTPDQNWLITRSPTGVVQRWAISDVLQSRAQPQMVLSSQAGITSMALDPTGHWLAAGDYDGKLIVRSLIGATAPIPTLAEHTGSINALTFSPDGHWLVTSGSDATSRVWDVAALTGDAIPLPGQVLKAHESAVSASAISADNRLYTSSWDGTVHQWDLPTTDYAQPEALTLPDAVSQLIVSGDNRWLITTGEGPTITLQNFQTILTSTTQPITLPVMSATLSALAASPDGHWLAASGEDNVIQLYDLHAADLSHAARQLVGHTGQVTNIIFSADGHWLLTIGADNTTRLWDLTAADPTQTSRVLTQGELPSTWAFFSPNGQWLITYNTMTGHLLWNLQATTPVSKPIDLAPHTSDSLMDAAFSSDSQRILFGFRDGSAQLWDLAADGLSGQPRVFPARPGLLRNVGFSQGDRYAVILYGLPNVVTDQSASSLTGSGASYLWDWRNPDQPPLILPQSQMASAMLSPDRRWLLVASDALRLWDLAAPNPAVTALTFSDPTVFSSILGPDRLAAFSPDGHWLMAAAGNTLRLWNLHWEELAAQACQSVGRNFSRLEWNQFFPDQPYRQTCSQWPLEQSGQ